MFPGPPNPEDASAAAHPRLQEIPSTEEELQAGWIFAVDKPLEWTSFDVVNKLKYALRRAYGLKSVKIGHAGTLDPLATGVLVVCVGKATKRIESEMAGSKGYRARLKLGFTTPSYDAETPEEAFSGAVFPSSTAALEAALPNFRGTIHQRPPLYSALKIGGQTLYKLARKGQEVEIPTRPVVVESLEIDSFDSALGSVELSIVCGKGTYIRSLAHDLGHDWGCGAYLAALRRTHVGPWMESDAWSLPNLLDVLGQREAARTAE